MAITDPPLSETALNRLVLRWQPHVRTDGIGAHLRRRQGHSLAFREYRPYQRGDDIRAVDWRASLRLPRRSDLLVRSFEVEEKLTLAILVDNRPDMLLPATMPKLLYALWALRALVSLGLDKGDEVVVARLFRGPGEQVLSLRGSGGRAAARSWAETVWAGRSDATATFDSLSAITRRLRPAGAVILLSDMLFPDPDAAFTRFARAAQQRRRSLSVLQLDSVRHEIGLLRAAQEFRLPRPDQPQAEGLHQFDDAAFAEAGRAVDRHLSDLRQALQCGGLDWADHPVDWPDAAPAADQAADQAEAALRAHFAETFPRSRLIAGLSLGQRA